MRYGICGWKRMLDDGWATPGQPLYAADITRKSRPPGLNYLHLLGFGKRLAPEKSSGRRNRRTTMNFGRKWTIVRRRKTTTLGKREASGGLRPSGNATGVVRLCLIAPIHS